MYVSRHEYLFEEIDSCDYGGWQIQDPYSESAGWSPGKMIRIFFLIQIFNGLDKTHLRCGRQCALLKIHWLKCYYHPKTPSQNMQNNVWSKIWAAYLPSQINTSNIITTLYEYGRFNWQPYSPLFLRSTSFVTRFCSSSTQTVVYSPGS